MNPARWQISFIKCLPIQRGCHVHLRYLVFFYGMYFPAKTVYDMVWCAAR